MTLRIGFLPSDFNPMLLMLGEAEDLHALAGVLRRFARDGAAVRLDEPAFRAGCGTGVVVMGEAGPLGLHVAPGTPEAFVWRLDAARAATFADRVDGLAAPGRTAGSEMLECGVEEPGEIPVKVSRGEYTDDFLLR